MIFMFYCFACNENAVHTFYKKEKALIHLLNKENEQIEVFLQPFISYEIMEKILKYYSNEFIEIYENTIYYKNHSDGHIDIKWRFSPTLKKTMKELTHYRLSIFADYGFSNIHSYRPNPVPYNGETYGGLVGINSDMSLDPHSVLGYEANKTAALNNMLIGIKLDVKFEIPKKGPKGLPYMYVYVHDQQRSPWPMLV